MSDRVWLAIYIAGQAALRLAGLVAALVAVFVALTLAGRPEAASALVTLVTSPLIGACLVAATVVLPVLDWIEGGL